MAQRYYGANPNDSRTGIPAPSSAMKASANYLQHSISSNSGAAQQQRASLAPPSGRAPSRSNGPRKSNFGVPQAVTRGAPPGASSLRGPSSSQQSSQHSQQQNSQQHLLSASQAWDHTRTPMKSSTANNNFASSVSGSSVNRRSTMGGGSLATSSVSRPSRSGAGSAAMGGAAGSRAPLRDIRPTRDPSWQKMAQMEIYEYLMENKTDMEIPFLTPAVLKSPTSKQFEEIWKFLVLELDPDWVAENQKVQDEFVPVMKDLQYPFAETITKSALSAINSPHSWAAITAALHWMVREARVCHLPWQMLTFLISQDLVLGEGELAIRQ
jgi:kinetochore protein NDC80